LKRIKRFQVLRTLKGWATSLLSPHSCESRDL
jgi:hypothetical protein